MTGVNQTAFRSAMMDPDHPVPEGLLGKNGEPAGKRFDVYRNNIAVGLIDALGTGFPVVKDLVGEEFFKAMAGVFFRNHPPKSPLMKDFGAEFPGFLKGFEPARTLRYLPDVARLEFALRQSYHAADADPVGSDPLTALSPDQFSAATFTFAPAVKLLSSRQAFYSIWAFSKGITTARPEKSPEDVLITRPDFDPRPHLISRDEAMLVAALMEGKPLATALALSGSDIELGRILGLLFAENAVTAID